MQEKTGSKNLPYTQHMLNLGCGVYVQFGKAGLTRLDSPIRTPRILLHDSRLSPTLDLRHEYDML
jgi:hypothetical protein